MIGTHHRPQRAQGPQGQPATAAPLSAEEHVARFRAKLADTAPEQLRQMRAEPAKRRAHLWLMPQYIGEDEPEVAAAKILTFHDGDGRAAEADAWEIYNLAAGGSWGEGRPNVEPGKIALAIVRHITENTEQPPVPRAERPQPSFL